MKDVNKVHLLGRLGTDPVLKETKKGIDMAQFALATSRKFLSPIQETEAGSDQGENSPASKWSEETQWHRIVVWGKQALACAQYLKKGQPVYVEGTLRGRKFEGKDGKDKFLVEIHAEEVSFLGSKAAGPRKSSNQSEDAPVNLAVSA